MVRQHKRHKPRRPATAVAKWSGRAALAIGIICLGLGAITPAAGADNARIAAEARCDRVVSWVVQAVADTSGGKADTAAEADLVRSNDSVEVSYRPAASKGSGSNGSGAKATTSDGWKTVETSALNAANDFSFSGSFPLPDSVDSVELRVLPKVDWADGSKAGSPKYAVATVPDECASMPAVAVITPDCEAGGAVVNMRNAGDGLIDLTLSVDRAVARKVQLSAAADEQVVVPIIAGGSSVIRVNADNFVVAQRKVDSTCTLSGPAAVVLERCPTHQAVVAARTTPESDTKAGVPIEIRAGGAIVHKASLTPGKLFERTLDLPSDGPIPVEVAINGQTAAVGQFGSCDGPVVGAISCGGSGQPVCDLASTDPQMEPPPPPPPPLTIEFGPDGLPVTGPWQRAIALLIAGGLLSAGGVAIIADQRRRPKPSLLATSVDAYRRQWWS